MPTQVYDGAVYDESNMYEDDKKLVAQFFVEAVKNEFKSAQEGRAIFDEIVMIRILTPGSRDVMTNKANDQYKARFPRQWALFEQKRQQTVDGTPLEQVPFLTVGQIAELKALNVHTLEQLATLADTVAHKVMGFQELKRKAAQFLEAAKSAAPITMLNEQLAQRDAQIAAMQQQIDRMQAAFDRLDKQTQEKLTA